MTADPGPIAAREHLRAHNKGVLIADGLADRIDFIIDSDTGRIVFPTTPAVSEAFELVLFVPEEEPQETDELQLLLSPGRLNPDRDAACDRWRTYHGNPRFTRWLACSIESARFAGNVVESEQMNLPNPLRGAEPALCRLLNADCTKLGALCQAIAGIAPRDPLAVGVDDTGIHIRARFGIIRIPLPSPTADAAEAEAAIRSMLEHPQR